MLEASVWEERAVTLRMVFERDDLQQVRVAGAVDPMWELVLSLHKARHARVAGHLQSWQRETRDRVRRSDKARSWLGSLFTLVPPTGSFPDFLTPTREWSDVDGSFEDMAGTKRTRLSTDVAASFSGRPVPGWVRRLAAGDRHQLHGVVTAARGAYRLLVEPHWHDVSAVVCADRAQRVNRLADVGMGAMLADMPGVLGWDGTVLETQYPFSRTIHLDGRGLRLVPSYFCTGAPVTLVDTELPPTLIYPATRISQPMRTTVSAGLTALLGRTRAECLFALRSPLSTSELAAKLGTSIGTASKQAAVLRDAGLVDSTRDRACVLHSLTDLGAALLFD